MGEWLRQRQPKDLRVISSPSVRTLQTAEALKLPFKPHRKIGPDACVSELIAASGWPQAAAIDHWTPAITRAFGLVIIVWAESEWTIKKVRCGG